MENYNIEVFIINLFHTVAGNQKQQSIASFRDGIEH